VTVGDGAPLEIVCGATNIAVGQRVPVALPGAVLPGDRRIERTEKMGVISEGMLCSGDELRLTADEDGILILPDDAPLGSRLVDLYGDVVLDVDVKPNRGDALSIVGLAREVGAATGAPVGFPATDVDENGGPIADRLRVEVEDRQLCPRFVGRVVTGLQVGPSPDRVQMRLLAAGQRPVSNVVDASNYVMLELGKPIHTFDAGAVADGRLIVRRARKGETLETLDHVARSLTEDTLLIADDRGPVAIAGVMGGAASEVGPATVDVIVESAIFDPLSIRRTAAHYALRSEASQRFEKGQESRLARLGADRTARLVREWAGGDVASGRVDTAPDEPDRARVAFRPARVDRLLGTTLGADEQAALLARVGIGIETAPAGVTVPVAMGDDPLAVLADTGARAAVVAVVPTWRRDIVIEADVAEEVARVMGYERTPGMRPDTAMPAYRPSPLAVRDLVRETLAGAGLTEIVTHALVAPEDVERFGPLEDPAPASEGRAGGAAVLVTNPLSRDHSVMRQSLVGSLLAVVAANRRRGLDDVAVFEIGRGYARSADGPAEWTRLGLALCGSATPAHWADAARPWDVDDAKGVLELVGRRLGLASPGYEALPNDPNLHPGRSLRLRVDGPAGEVAMAGRLGELHPGLLEALDVRAERVVVAEVAVVGLSGGVRAPVRAAAPPRHPAVERDLAVVVPEATAASSVAGAVRGAAGDLLVDLRLFDVYRGAPLPDDHKSLAWRLVFQAPDRTLTEGEIDLAVGMATDAIAAIGGRLRA
jgi:phenylalanyl-tRNA synthetase beta chain